MLKVRSRWAAYQFDEALAVFGHVVQSRLDETEKQGDKIVRKYTLEQALGLQPMRTSILGLMFASGATELTL